MARVPIDDALYDRYAAYAAEAKQPVEQVIARQLARTVDYPPTVRTVIIARDHLEQIERLLGGGQIRKPQDLLDRIRAWAGITIGGVRLDLSPAQLEEIGHRAAKQGKSPQAVVEDLVAQLTESLFYGTVPTR